MLKHLPLQDPKIRITKGALVDCCCSADSGCQRPPGDRQQQSTVSRIGKDSSVCCDRSADSGRLEATGKVGGCNQLKFKYEINIAFVDVDSKFYLGVGC